MKKLISTALAAVFVLALSGCNTWAGLGQDLEKAGGAIQEKAKR